MSFREIAVTIRAVNHASAEFNRIQTDAESLATRVKSLGAAIAGIGAAGTAIGYIANQFGLLNDSHKCFHSRHDGGFSDGHVHAYKRRRGCSSESVCCRNSVCHGGPKQPKHQLRNLSGIDGCRDSGDCCCSRCHVRFCQ